MKRIMMHGKIHRATVTDANIDYVGSITLDPVLIELSGMLPFEQVHVVDIDNGQRFQTYIIEGDRDSGQVVLNGAAARLVQKGDKVIVIAYAEMEDDEAQSLVPRVVLVDDSNRPITVAADH
ncbi:MAG: aspartate 1-decarboxylase [Actinomycetota bacterium]|nr:aspartate 1-decarboxylase [Actinomycetota bacterium]